jgi:hypothetical protein
LKKIEMADLRDGQFEEDSHVDDEMLGGEGVYDEGVRDKILVHEN